MCFHQLPRQRHGSRILLEELRTSNFTWKTNKNLLPPSLCQELFTWEATPSYSQSAAMIHAHTPSPAISTQSLCPQLEWPTWKRNSTPSSEDKQLPPRANYHTGHLFSRHPQISLNFRFNEESQQRSEADPDQQPCSSP